MLLVLRQERKRGDRIHSTGSLMLNWLVHKCIFASNQLAYFEGRPPTGRFGDGSVEDREVDEGVRRHEKVGQERGNGVEFG